MATSHKLLIQMSGAPGSGKSTLAHLSRPLSAQVISHDLLKTFFLSHNLDSFNQVAKLTYSLQWTLASDALSQGRNVIVDGTCNYEETLAQGTALAKQFGFEYVYVECKVDDIELLDGRLRRRVPMRSQRGGVDVGVLDAVGDLDADFDYRAQYRGWMENPCRPASGAIVVDATRGPEECRDNVLGRIGFGTGSNSGEILESEIVKG